MNDLERYQCQMALPGFGKEAQERLRNARILVVGAGGLGCPALQYLAAAGIGTLGIADDDTVSESNLHRQILYTPEDTGLPKAETAAKKLRRQNPSVNVMVHNERVTSANVAGLIAGYDLIIEGTDNFETKTLLNDACVLAGKPLVYGAIYQFEGQVAVWNVKQADGSFSAHYRDVFPGAEHAQVPNCRDGGVIPTLAGIVGCMQANEALKFFTRPEELLAGKLWMINLANGKTRIIQLKKHTQTAMAGLSPTVQQLSWEEVQEKLKHPRVALIDVRTEDKHQHFHVGGKNIPIDQLESRSAELEPYDELIFYCTSGNKSTRAARLSASLLPDSKVYSLINGISSLKQE